MIHTEWNSEILILVLDDPSTRNSFGLGAAKEFSQALKTKKAKGILIQSRGLVFCSGGDLKQYGAMGSLKSDGQKVNATISKVLRQLDEYPRPLVMSVGGDCIGGGLELLSCGDAVLSATAARF